MDFTSELLARLQKGESVDSLAAELTKAINDAHAENERIKAETEAKRKAEIKAQDKYDAIESLLGAVESVIIAWDLGDDILGFIQKIDTDELVQELNEVIPAAKAYVELADKLGELRQARPVAPNKEQDDPIEAFLNQFVR